jgi:hypothetical protein
MQIASWEEVAINLIGPWAINADKKKVEFNALAYIGTNSNLA